MRNGRQPSLSFLSRKRVDILKFSCKVTHMEPDKTSDRLYTDTELLDLTISDLDHDIENMRNEIEILSSKVCILLSIQDTIKNRRNLKKTDLSHL